jgi:hypothetical protein
LCSPARARRSRTKSYWITTNPRKGPVSARGKTRYGMAQIQNQGAACASKILDYLCPRQVLT